MRRVSFAVGSRCALVAALIVVSTSFTKIAWADEPPAESPVAKATDAAPAAKPQHHGSAFVDPLGFALFGPRLGVEIGAGHVSGALQARWFNPGLLAHSLFLHEGDEFAFSYGAGLRGRYYLPEGLSGLHFGAAIEYLRVRVEDRQVLLATVSSYLVPYAEAGYRLSFGPVYADASAGFGYALRASSNVENLPGGSAAGAYVATNESSVYGTASLDLGIFF
jgi:hypothetical protein